VLSMKEIQGVRLIHIPGAVVSEGICNPSGLYSS
jgi:hypothetical protein